MKTTLELPDELMQIMKMRAAAEGRKLKDVIAELLKAGLQNTNPIGHSSEGIRQEKDPKTGLPVIRAVSDSPGSKMTIEDLKRLEQDVRYLEDLKRAVLTP